MIILASLAIILVLITWWRDPGALVPALRTAMSSMAVIGIRIPLALLSAAFISIVMPPTMVAPFIGAESGWVGILIALVVGGILPGGPMLTFPLALVIWRAGAGDAQMIAFLASWSMLAFYRTVAYDLPILGAKFVVLRLASTWMLPMLAGVIALGLIALLGTPSRP